jgi:hypothetical protein
MSAWCTAATVTTPLHCCRAANVGTTLHVNWGWPPSN